MSKAKEEEKKFDLQKYICSKEGDEWLREVKVHDSNNKFFRYYAPSVAWEDIDRHNQSAFGDFIFDVTIKIKQNSNNNVCRSRVIFCIIIITSRHLTKTSRIYNQTTNCFVL